MTALCGAVFMFCTLRCFIVGFVGSCLVVLEKKGAGYFLFFRLCHVCCPLWFVCFFSWCHCKVMFGDSGSS